MLHGRIISIILKKLLKKEIGDKEGEPLNGNKKITQKLFDNWKKNPVESLRSKLSEGSERTITEVQKPEKKKAKKKTVEIEEESRGSAAPEINEALTSTAEKPKKRKADAESKKAKRADEPTWKGKKRRRTSTKTPSKPIEEDETAGMATVPEPMAEEEMAGTADMPEPTGREEVAVTVPTPEPKKKLKRKLRKMTLKQKEVETAQVEGEPRANVPEVTQRAEVSEAAPNVEQPGSPDYFIEAEDSTVVFKPENQLLYYFMPVVPWMKTLVQKDFSYMTWAFSKYPNINVLAQNFPRVRTFAQRLISYNNEAHPPSSGSFNKVTTIDPLLMLKIIVKRALEEASGSNRVEESVNHLTDEDTNTPSFIHSFNPPIVESQNSTIGTQIFKAHTFIVDNSLLPPLATETSPSTPLPLTISSSTSDSESNSSDVEIISSPTLEQTFSHTKSSNPDTNVQYTSNTHTNTPSSSNTHIQLGFPIHTSSPTAPVDSTFENINVEFNNQPGGLVEEIYKRVSTVPSKAQLEHMLSEVVEECEAGMKAMTFDISRNLNNIVQAAEKVPGEMSREFKETLNDLIRTVINNLQKRDDLHFSELAKIKNVVVSLQSTNTNSIKLLSDKVFDMNSSLIDFKGVVLQSMERTDTALAVVHQQRAQAEQRESASQDDVVVSRTQMQELLDTIRRLSDEVTTLRSDMDDAKKGEKRRRQQHGESSKGDSRKASQPSSQPPPVPLALPLPQDQSARSTPRTSSGVTPTGSRLPNVNDPGYLNRNLYGINIAGEEPSNSQFLGPRDSIEEMRRKQEEDRRAYERRVAEERRNPPRRRNR